MLSHSFRGQEAAASSSWRGGWGFGEFQVGRELKLFHPNPPPQPCPTASSSSAACSPAYAPGNPAYIWIESVASAKQPSPCSRGPARPQCWLYLGSGEGKVTTGCAEVCGPAHPDFQSMEASQNTCSPWVVGFQSNTKLSSSIPYTAIFHWVAKTNQPNGSSAPSEGYRAKAEPCPRCSAFSKIKS